jgi:uroporphyrinogen decarboxylase
MNKPLQNDSFLKACLRQATDHTPVWLMRQAGRYLPEYCATRAKAGSFMGLATNVDYATEVTLQPLDRYPLDASILFSDILTVPDAMGLGLSFAQGEGPKFARCVRDEAAINARRASSDSWRNDKARPYSPWTTSPEAMWRKSAIRALRPYLPLTAEAARALDTDERILTFGDDGSLTPIVDADSDEIIDTPELEQGEAIES